MNVLLDTCAFIWLCSDPEKFSPAARDVLVDNAGSELYLSDASVFEIAIKSAQKKLDLPDTAREWVQSQIETWGIISLPISQEVIFASTDLPLQHKDPFDRLIVATAAQYKIPVISPDEAIHQYDIDVIW